MTSSMAQDITQAVTFVSDVQSNLPFQADKSVVSRSGVGVSSAGASTVVSDTVSISFQSKQAVAGEVKKELSAEAAKKEKATKKDATTRSANENLQRALSKVQFVYNQRGELIVKYMDASDRLVYQIPSELMLFQKESALKVRSSVDARA